MAKRGDNKNEKLVVEISGYFGYDDVLCLQLRDNLMIVTTDDAMSNGKSYVTVGTNGVINCTSHHRVANLENVEYSPSVSPVLDINNPAFTLRYFVPYCQAAVDHVAKRNSDIIRGTYHHFCKLYNFGKDGIMPLPKSKCGGHRLTINHHGNIITVRPSNYTDVVAQIKKINGYVEIHSDGNVRKYDPDTSTKFDVVRDCIILIKEWFKNNHIIPKRHKEKLRKRYCNGRR